MAPLPQDTENTAEPRFLLATDYWLPATAFPGPHTGCGWRRHNNPSSHFGDTAPGLLSARAQVTLACDIRRNGVPGAGVPPKQRSLEPAQRVVEGWGTLRKVAWCPPALRRLLTGNPIGWRAIAVLRRRRVVAHLLRSLGRESNQLLDYLPSMFVMNKETWGVPQPVVRSYPLLALNPFTPNKPSVMLLLPTVMSWNDCLSRPLFRP